MQKVRVPQNSFQFGEVSDSLKMRTDTGVYTGSAQKVENMIITVEGSAKKRTGLKNIYDYSITYDSSNPNQSHLFPFIFDNNEQYIISIEHQKVRCFRVVDSTTITLVATITADTSSAALPFDKVYLQQYTAAQMGDVMFICHPLFAPRVLTRTSLTAFEISTYTFDTRADNKQIYQPYSKYQSVGVTLDPSATTGNGITLTTSSAYWDITGSQSGGNYPDSLHVGVVVRYGGNEITITSVQSATQATGNVSEELKVRLAVANPLRTNNGSDKVEVTQLGHGYGGGESIVISDAIAVGGINAGNINGTRTVADIIDDNTYNFTAASSANDSEDGGGFPKIATHAATLDWDEQAWSAKRGYPAAVAFHENRLVFAGTLAEPDSIFMSEVGQYFNHDVGTALDNEAIKLTAATGDVHEIRYLISSRDLQVFAGTGELYVPTYLNQAITPTNAQIREQTPYGSAFVNPSLIDGSTIFVQTSGRIVREYLFTDSEDAYASTAISTISSHLINTPKYMAVVHSGFNEPDSYAVISMEDGDAAVFTSNRAEKRASWVEFTTNGRFDSLVSIDDRLFCNVYDSNNKLKLCEFTGSIGLDVYNETSHAVISVTNYIVILTSGSTTVTIRLFGSFSGLSVGDKISVTGFDATNSGLLDEVALVNKKTHTLTAASSTDIDFNVTLPSGAGGSIVININPATNRNVFTNAEIDVTNIYTAGNIVDIITESSGANNYFGQLTVAASGSNAVVNITSLPDFYTPSIDKVYIGKSFTSKIISNPVDASSGAGPLTGMLRGITNVVVDMKETRSIKVNSKSINLESNFTGKKEVRLLGYNRDPQVTIEQSDPLDMQVNGFISEVII
tara:strand:+ start:2916 stop:5468 length:2553 start_codon:yes stop_codon:yes gene_type:complete